MKLNGMNLTEDIHTTAGDVTQTGWDLVRIDYRANTATVIGRYDDFGFADDMRRAERLMTAAADLVWISYQVHPYTAPDQP